MPVKYLADKVAQPSQLACWVAAFAMLYRWGRARLGLPNSHFPLSHFLENRSLSVPPLHWRQVAPLCSQLGFDFKYISTHPAVWESTLGEVGPFVYIANMTVTHGHWQHALLVTGMANDADGSYRIYFNDPDGGLRRDKPFLEFMAEYTVYFKNPDSAGEEQTSVMFFHNPYKKK